MRSDVPIPRCVPCEHKTGSIPITDINGGFTAAWVKYQKMKQEKGRVVLNNMNSQGTPVSIRVASRKRPAQPNDELARVRVGKFATEFGTRTNLDFFEVSRRELEPILLFFSYLI